MKTYVLQRCSLQTWIPHEKDYGSKRLKPLQRVKSFLNYIHKNDIFASQSFRVVTASNEDIRMNLETPKIRQHNVFSYLHSPPPWMRRWWDRRRVHSRPYVIGSKFSFAMKESELVERGNRLKWYFEEQTETWPLEFFWERLWSRVTASNLFCDLFLSTMSEIKILNCLVWFFLLPENFKYPTRFGHPTLTNFPYSNAVNLLHQQCNLRHCHKFGRCFVNFWNI